MRTRRGWGALATAGALLVVFAAAGQSQDYLLKVGATAPDFALKTPDGKTIRLKELTQKNKAVLVNFFFNG